MKRCALIVVLLLVLYGCTATPHREYDASELADQAAVRLSWARDAVLSQYPNAVLPHVKVVRHIGWSEWSAVTAGCLSTSGWDSNTVRVSERGAYRVAEFVCGAEYPIDPQLALPLDRDQEAYLYAYYVEQLTPCLSFYGFSSTGSVPSESEFESSYETHPWNPYIGIPRDAPWGALSRNCPPVPPGFYDH